MITAIRGLLPRSPWSRLLTTQALEAIMSAIFRQEAFLALVSCAGINLSLPARRRCYISFLENSLRKDRLCWRQKNKHGKQRVNNGDRRGKLGFFKAMDK